MWNEQKQVGTAGKPVEMAGKQVKPDGNDW